MMFIYYNLDLHKKIDQIFKILIRIIGLFMKRFDIVRSNHRTYVSLIRNWKIIDLRFFCRSNIFTLITGTIY